MRTRKILLAFATLWMLLLMAGCSGGKNTKAVRLENGVLNWDETKAVYYEVKLDDVTQKCEEETLDLSVYCKYEGKHTVGVSAVDQNGKKKEIGSIEIEATKLSKPAVVVEGNEDGSRSFVWAADDKVRTYQYDLHDGNGKKTITSGEGNLCRVAFEGKDKTYCTVEAIGTSEKNVVYLKNDITYQFEGSELFDLASLANYPFYFVSDGDQTTEYKLPTTLPTGNYKLEVVAYIMDSNGNTVQGNGTWGRRLVDNAKEFWFCETNVGNYNCAETIVSATEATTLNMNLIVNKYGEALINVYNFNLNEMVVFADCRLDGKSVLAASRPTYSKNEAQFDTAKLDEFTTVYYGVGQYFTGTDAPDEFKIKVPVDWKDGTYRVKIEYQLMTSDGRALSGNGLWGRRICDEYLSEKAWCTETPITGETDGINMDPNEVFTSEFSVNVKDGKFVLVACDFSTGEIVAVRKVTKLFGGGAKFDISKLSSCKNVFVSTGAADLPAATPEQFKVQTTLCERKVVDVEVTYYAMREDGGMLIGNGRWGRRITDDAKDHWICSSVLNGNAKTANTIPEASQEVTTTMKVTLNNKGRFTLNMYDFNKGEIVVIKDVKLNGVSIMK